MTDPTARDLIQRLAVYAEASPMEGALTIAAEAFAWLSGQPPCQECGAMTPQEAETRCVCGGDKDHCHGCDLWPDDDATPEPAAGPSDEELMDVFDAAWREDIPHVPILKRPKTRIINGLRAVIARWGHPA